MKTLSRGKAGTTRDWQAAISIFAPIAFVIVVLGPALIGLKTFAAVDLVESQAPWRNTTEFGAPLNRCVSDTIDSVLPELDATGDRVRDGDVFPLIDPLPSAGYSVAGGFSYAYWSPLSWPALLVPTSYAPALIKVLELVAVFAGMWWWLRRLKLGVPARLTAGMIFATSGFMVVWTNWPQTRTAAIFPLVFWAVERVVQERTVRSAWPLALAVAAMLSGGFIAIGAHCLYAAVAYAIVRIVAERMRTRDALPVKTEIRTLVIGASAFAVGLGIVAFQLVSFAQYLGATDLDSRGNAWRRTLDPTSGITTIFPLGLGACGSPLPGWGPGHPVERNFFIGAAALMLALVAITVGRRMRLVPPGVLGFATSGAALVAALLYVGRPFNWMLHYLPLIDSNSMTRVRGIGAVFFALLAAIGIEVLSKRMPPASRVEKTLQAVAPVVFIGLAGLTLYVARKVGQHWAILPSVALGLVSAMAVWLAWIRFTRWHKLAAAALALIPILVAAEGLVFVNASWPRLDGELYRTTDTTEYLQVAADGYRIAPLDGTYWGGTSATAGIRSLTGHTFVPTEWREMLGTIEGGMFESPTNHRLHQLESLEEPLLDRLSVSHGVAPLRDVPLGRLRAVPDTPRLRDGMWDGTPLKFTVTGERLRGLVLPITAEPPLSGKATFITAEVTDGEQSVSTSVRVWPTGTFAIPLAAEDLSGPLTVTLSHDLAAPLMVSTTASGLLEVDAVWADDDLKLVRAVDAQIYERPNALPRIRWADSVATYDGLDAFRELALDTPAATALVPADTSDVITADGASARVSVIEDSGDSIHVEVDAEGPGLLVIADAYRDGWHAVVDGKTTAIRIVDYSQMGIPVSEGEHRITLVYDPEGWGDLSLVALALLLGTGAVAAWDISRRRRQAEILRAD